MNNKMLWGSAFGEIYLFYIIIKNRLYVIGPQLYNWFFEKRVSRRSAQIHDAPAQGSCRLYVPRGKKWMLGNFVKGRLCLLCVRLYVFRYWFWPIPTWNIPIFFFSMNFFSNGRCRWTFTLDPQKAISCSIRFGMFGRGFRVTKKHCTNCNTI